MQIFSVPDKPGRYTGSMFFLRPRRTTLLAALSAAVCLLAGPSAAHAWGNEGHRMINRLAAQTLPTDVPAFLKTPAALDEIEYLGPEPDRWRSPAEPELNAVQAPEHFIDLELADKFLPLPHKRFDFEAEVFAAGQRPDKIGLQPWQTEEVWERLKAAMREYRTLSAEGKNTHPVEQAILFYAGWLGHYVGDGSQPLHTTIQYNGWIGPNPNGYTTSHQIHWEFEGPFVAANIHSAEIQARMTPAKAIDGDLFDAYMVYLRHTSTFVERVYQLEKDGGFVGAGTPESRAFTVERLAAGASMLRNMIYSAWLDSAQPVPAYHPAK
ncbi:MAG TPA: S1/P1 nuclease [Terracidiphilus sp.]|nr:S1/P1 nuclease [Terracidiphilus sp.]